MLVGGNNEVVKKEIPTQVKHLMRAVIQNNTKQLLNEQKRLNKKDAQVWKKCISFDSPKKSSKVDNNLYCV